MPTERKHLINVHTSTGTTQPESAGIVLGEIAVQHTSGSPALWIKMGTSESSDTYEKFIGETEINTLINSCNILGSGYTYSGLSYVNSATTIAAAYSALTEEYIESDYVAAEALNDLNSRIRTLSADTQESLSALSAQIIAISGAGSEALSAAVISLSASVVTNSSNTESLSAAVVTLSARTTTTLGPEYTYSGIPYVNSATTIADAYSALTQILFDDEYVISSSFNDLNERINELSGASSTEVTQPESGMVANKLYTFGVITADTTFELAAPEDNNVINHWYWTFETSSTIPNITWPAEITRWLGGSEPVLSSGMHYEISVLDGVAVFMEV